MSTVTKFWPDATACKARATVVVFVLRSVSSRRERCQRRSEARAATFHARRRAELAVADAQSAGTELARDLMSFAEISADAGPFVPMSELSEVQQEAKDCAEIVLARCEQSGGGRFGRLPGGRMELVLTQGEFDAGIRGHYVEVKWHAGGFASPDRIAALCEVSPSGPVSGDVVGHAASPGSDETSVASADLDAGRDLVPKPVCEPASSQGTPASRRAPDSPRTTGPMSRWGVLHGLQKAS